MPSSHTHKTSPTETLTSIESAVLSKGGRRILENVSIKVRRGEIVTLIGPNGAGKSMLIRVALGLEKLDSGYVQRSTGISIGYQPQQVKLDETLPISVRRFLSLGQPQPTKVLKNSLADVRIPHLLNANIHRLSGGELQRVMLARATLHKPDLLVLDEPEQNLDTDGAIEIYQLIARLREETGCGVLLVSHDLHVIMAATDRVYCLNGHMCCSGTPDEISGHAEFLRLFGPLASKTLAFYSHKHDHHHEPDGSVTETLKVR